jgi:hypothetical protein
VFVIAYEPSDDQICALIQHLANQGMPDVTPGKAKIVARFLLAECQRLGIRPSVRLFMDKAIPDFRLYTAGKTETHWRDLVRSNLEQQLVELQHPTTNLTRADQIESEQRIALEVHLKFKTVDQRVQAWKERTSKSQAALYRRLAELRDSGRLPTAGATGVDN